MRKILSTCLLILILVVVATAPITVHGTSYGTYADLILSTFAGHIVAYWPLNEISGTVAEDISGNNLDGTYYGVTLDSVDGPGDSFGRAGLWDGVNDYVNVYSTSLRDEIRLDHGTIAGWIMVPSEAWTDAQYRASALFYQAPSQYITMQKPGTDNRILLRRTDSGGNREIYIVTNSTEWIHLAITYDSDENSTRFYYNGVEQTPSAPASNDEFTIITARIGSQSGNAFWIGSIQHLILLDYAAYSSDIATLANPDYVPPTPTPTPTPALIAYATTSSGQLYAIDHTISAGQIANMIPALILISFLVVLLLLKLARRQ